MSSLDHSPVIIIGAGFAGLLAASYLERENKPYLILEAKAQCGGRILANSDVDHAIDLGPTWLFSHQPNIRELLKQLGLDIFTQHVAGEVLFEAADALITPMANTPAADMYRLKGGMYRLITSLVAKLDGKQLKMSHPVTQVKREKDLWLLESKGQSFSCDQLILAIPPRMIMQHLTPQHWADEALQRSLNNVPTWMAAQAKCVISYAEPFWRERGLSGQVFSRRGPMQEIHDASDERGHSAALFGFIGVPALHRKRYTQAQIKAACIEQLVNIYGEQASDYKQCYLQDWAQDSWVASDRDITEPAAHPYIDLKPFAKQLETLQLKLVASECAEHEAGYLEGVIEAVNKAL